MLRSPQPRWQDDGRYDAGLRITYHAAGETIAYHLGVADSGGEAARAFIACPVHHAILFDPTFTGAGVGHAVDASGKHDFTIIVIG